MLAAALVLFLSSRGKRGAAVKQGALPLLGVVFLMIGLLG
jgi:putative membrane protein